MPSIYVFAKVVVEGFHRWPKAVGEEYLRHRHRHKFEIFTRLSVEKSDRDVEFISLGRYIRKDILVAGFGDPCEFGDLSCEKIAEMIYMRLRLKYGDDRTYEITVSEDGENGATYAA